MNSILAAGIISIFGLMDRSLVEAVATKHHHWYLVSGVAGKMSQPIEMNDAEWNLDSPRNWVCVLSSIEQMEYGNEHRYVRCSWRDNSDIMISGDANCGKGNPSGVAQLRVCDHHECMSYALICAYK